MAPRAALAIVVVTAAPVFPDVPITVASALVMLAETARATSVLATIAETVFIFTVSVIAADSCFVFIIGLAVIQRKAAFFGFDFANRSYPGRGSVFAWCSGRASRFCLCPVGSR